MLGEHCRFYTGLPAKLRELAIMITARHVSAPLEFHVHAMEAREFGITEEKIVAIAQQRTPPDLDEDEALIYEFCSEMFATGRIDDGLFDRAKERFGKEVIIDLIATCGYYKTLGFVINVTQAQPPDFLAGFVPAFSEPV